MKTPWTYYTCDLNLNRTDDMELSKIQRLRVIPVRAEYTGHFSAEEAKE
jgi:hypothetical protein